MTKILLNGRPLRVLWCSDAPWATSGYSNQTRLFAPRLADLCDLALLTTYGLHGGSLDWHGLKVYPGGADPFANDAIPLAAKDWQADIVITLKDTFVFNPQAFQGLRWCPLVPVDHEPAPPAVLGAVRHAYRPIAYAPNGVRALQAAGLDPLYAPHAYDPALLYPGDRDTARQALGLPADAFLVGTVAVNRGGVPSRKAWPQLIAGAGLARGRIPSLHYLAHTHHGMDRHEGAIPLPPLAGAAGLADRFIMPNEDVYKRGYTDDQMRTLYQALDVLLCVSLGEGFGIPTLEAQACGVPVIGGAWAAQADLIWGGWALRRDRDALAFVDQQDAAVYIPHPEAIARALIKAHADLADPVKAAPIQRKALRGAGAHEVSRVVADHWRPTLQALADQITRDSAKPRGVLRIVRPEEVLV